METEIYIGRPTDMSAIEDKNIFWEDTPVDITQDANFIWSIANKLIQNNAQLL